MKLRIELGYLESVPKWYGMAYHLNYKNTFVVCPIPLNVIVRIFRELYYWLVEGCFKSKREESLRQAYKHGEDEGYKRASKNYEVELAEARGNE